MQFLPKWSQIVSKFTLFHKWAIFKLNINFNFFANFYISEMFLPISQNSKMRKTVTNVTQKQKVVWMWLWKLTQMSIHRATKPRSLIFYIYFHIWIMLQSFLIGQLPVAMAIVLKIRLHGFVRNVLIHHLPKLNVLTCNILFLTYVCYSF